MMLHVDVFRTCKQVRQAEMEKAAHDVASRKIRAEATGRLQVLERRAEALGMEEQRVGLDYQRALAAAEEPASASAILAVASSRHNQGGFGVALMATPKKPKKRGIIQSIGRVMAGKSSA